MSQEEVLKKVVDVLAKYKKADIANEDISMDTTILDQLQINSARLVDIVLDFEDIFDIEVEDEDADKVATVKDCVTLIMEKI